MLYTVIYDVSRSCNYRCVYCRNEWGNPANTWQASKKFAFGIVDRISKADVQRVIFTGGEFFMLAEWQKLLEYSTGKGLKNRIISNASLIDNRDISFLEVHCEQINVSFHAADRKLYGEIMGVKHDSTFNRVIDNMKAISNSEIRLGIFFSPLKSNYNLLFETIQFLAGEGIHIDELNLNRIIPTQHTLEYFRHTPPLNKSEHIKLIKQLINIRSSFGIDAFAEAYPVCFLRTFIANEELIRNINTPCLLGRRAIALNNDGTIKLCPATAYSISDPIEDLQKEFRTHQQLRKFRSSEWRDEKCNNCPDWDICMGGCHASRGELFSDDSLIQ